AYFYTCYTAFTLCKKAEKGESGLDQVSPLKKTVSGLGALASLVFIALLLIPGSPAFMGTASLISLLAWIALGFVFYLIKRSEFRSIPQSELRYLILGQKDATLKRKS